LSRPYLEKLFTNIGLVEWLKVEALSSSPSTIFKKKNTGLICIQDGYSYLKSKRLFL
jgi:hypothetical protein